jgi:hypothetical protein
MEQLMKAVVLNLGHITDLEKLTLGFVSSTPEIEGDPVGIYWRHNRGRGGRNFRGHSPSRGNNPSNGNQFLNF